MRKGVKNDDVIDHDVVDDFTFTHLTRAMRSEWNSFTDFDFVLRKQKRNWG